VQQYALATVVGDDRKREFDRDWRNFVLASIAAHPENARRLLRLLDRQEAEPGEFAEELDDEEMATYTPVQQREGLDKVLQDLTVLGFAYQSDE
jgi:hypothetical protein